MNARRGPRLYTKSKTGFPRSGRVFEVGRIRFPMPPAKRVIINIRSLF